MEAEIQGFAEKVLADDERLQRVNPELHEDVMSERAVITRCVPPVAIHQYLVPVYPSCMPEVGSRTYRKARTCLKTT